MVQIFYYIFPAYRIIYLPRCTIFAAGPCGITFFTKIPSLRPPHTSMPKPVKSDPRSGTNRGIGAFAYESSTVFRLSGVFHLLLNGELFLLLSPKQHSKSN